MKPLSLCLLFSLLFAASGYAQYVSGSSYYGVNNYIEYVPGDLPIILVAPHAGTLEPALLPDINNRGADNGTMALVRFMADSLHFKSGGCRPHVIINHLKPSKLNPVYAASDSILAAGSHPLAQQALNEFHQFIQVAHDQVSTDWEKGHYFELHGNGTAEAWNMIGLGMSKTDLNMSDSVIAARVNYSTVKNLCTVGGADFLEVLKGPTSLGGMLNNRGWKSTPSPAYPAPPDTVTFFFAGQNTWRYGSRNSGTIDATHLESYWEFMVLAANRSKYAHDLADSMLDFMGLHYGFTFSCEPLHSNEPSGKPARVKIFPNPIRAHEPLTIESQSDIAQVWIFNPMGQLCKKAEAGHTLMMGTLPNGIYTIVISTSDGKINHQKLVVLD